MWKLACSVLSLLSITNRNAATPAIRPNSVRGIIFPTVELYDVCFVDEQHTIKGTCKSLIECPSAMERWNREQLRPQTCYFNKFEHIVCCEVAAAPVIEPEVYTPPPSVQRRSEMACEKHFVYKIQVVRGEPSLPKEFPYMAALGWRSHFDNAIIYRCGGALISSKFVLTAAHCAQLGGDAPIVVRIGGVNLTDPAVTDVGIKRIIVHPTYDTVSANNDIALVELEQEVEETPACVWSKNDVEHNNVTAIGYGHTMFAGVSSDQLLKAPLFVVANDVCKKFYVSDKQQLQNIIGNSHICAGDPEHLRDTCQGDSGGPIIMKVDRDSTYSYVVGITSFGQGCAGEPPSIYTRTSAYIDWIEDIVWPAEN